MRRAFSDAMRDDMITTVQRLTGRSVDAFLSDHLHDPDVSIDVFLLHPPTATPRPARGPEAQRDDRP